MENVKNIFDPAKMQAVFTKVSEEQATAVKTMSEAAKLEAEEAAQFIANLKDKKTLDEIANSYIGYWSGVSVRSMGYAEKAKARMTETLKAFA